MGSLRRFLRPTFHSLPLLASELRSIKAVKLLANKGKLLFQVTTKGKRGDFKAAVKWYKEINQNEFKLIGFIEQDPKSLDSALKILFGGMVSESNNSERARERERE